MQALPEKKYQIIGSVGLCNGKLVASILTNK